MYILPHFLAYSKYYFCPGPQLQDLGGVKQTKKYFIGGICGRYLCDSFRWIISYFLLPIFRLVGNYCVRNSLGISMLSSHISLARVFLLWIRKIFLDNFGTEMLQYCYSDMLSHRNEKSS